MTEPMEDARTTFDRIRAQPVAADLWELQRALLIIGGEEATRARAVTREFHACLRSLESKAASRTASRWGAALGTAAVGSVSLPELLGRQGSALQRLLESGLPAVLEIGAAVRSAQAWEIEARLVYDEIAWFLYDELWDVSAAQPGLAPTERRDQIDLVVGPLLDPAVPDTDRATLVVNVFGTVLAARMLPLLETNG